MNYTLRQIADIVGGSFAGTDAPATSVITDSRNVAGDTDALFVAISGRNHDGHAYVWDLYSRGFKLFMVEQGSVIGVDTMPDAGFVVVPDSVSALQRLAAYHRDHFAGKVVAITGSNGKTIVKEWIAQLWDSSAGRLFRSPKSYNSQIGVPLSILMLRGDEQIAVIEAGISEPGEMAHLERIIRPDIGIITNIGDSHAENFTDIDQKLNEKLKLFVHTDTIIYNTDDPRISHRLTELYPDRHLIGWHSIDSERLNIPFTDSASRQNALAAMALYTFLGYDISAKLPNIQPVAMRLELKEGLYDSRIINDSYNSDIGSLAIALDYMNSVSGTTRRIVVLSDILQSGLIGSELYQRVADMLVASSVDLLIGIGDDIARYSGLFGCSTIFFRTTADMLRSLSLSKFAHATVLIKGCRSFGFERVSGALERQTHTTVLEVNLDALTHNLNHFRGLLQSNVKMMVMVKASSYGSGAADVASLLAHERVDYLAVAFADEGIALREAGITLPIVVLNSDPGSFGAMILHHLEPEIYSFSSLRTFADEVSRMGETAYPAHIKLDTGMHRLGFTPAEVDRLIAEIGRHQNISVVSVFTHFAASDEPQHDHFTQMQLDTFDKASRRIVEALPDHKILRHICNSAAIERFPEAHYDMVRLGIGIYGLSSTDQDKLQTVSVLRSSVVQVKEIPAGDTIGYGRHGHADTPLRTATIPIGYADGLNRRLGRGHASFMVGDVLCPTIGNICMDTCMLDVTGTDVKEGDSVVIFGENPSIITLAEQLGTIPYEILTSVSTRVKRIYTKE